MAPNNALRQPKPKRVTDATASIAATAATTATAASAVTGTTTILPPGTVESRGMGVNATTTTGSNISNNSNANDVKSNTKSNSNTENDDDGTATATTRSRVQRDIAAFVQGIERDASFTSIMASELRCFFTVWTFVTRFPAPTWVDHHPGYLMRGMVYFPVAGMLIGGWIALWYQTLLIALGVSSSVAACGATIAGVYLTGCFHEDGLGDASDGFGGGWTRLQILTIMTDTRLGTYGCVALILFLVTKIHIITSMAHAAATIDTNTSMLVLPPVMASIVVSQALARLTPTIMIHFFPYADEGGPKTHYYSFMVSARQLVTPTRVIVAVVYSGLTVGMLWYPHYYTYYNSVYQNDNTDTDENNVMAKAAATLAVGLVAALLLVVVLIISFCAGSYATYMIGGVMGDFLGAIICGTELVMLSLLSIVTPPPTPTTPLSSFLHWIVHHTVVSNFHHGNHQHHDWYELYPTTTEWKNLSHPLGISVAFVAVLTFTIAWCRTVGHPNVFVRDTVIQAMEQTTTTTNDTANDNAQIGLPVVVRGGSASVTEEKTSSASNNTNTVTTATTASSTTCPSRMAAERILQSATSSFQDRYNAALTYLDALAKPMGSLGTLEDWAARLAALQRTTRVTVGHVGALIFAADHGVAASSKEGGESASAYPQVVTQGIVKGLSRDIAGASVLARSNGITLLRVVDVGVVSSDDAAVGNAPTMDHQQQQGFTEVLVSDRKLIKGTRNFCRECAMTSDETERCVQIGRDELAQLVNDCGGVVKVVVLGEVGIGNTTSSSALIAYLATASVESVCGGGATVTRLVTPEAVDKKQTIVAKALDRHRDAMTSAMDALSRIGGAEIAAIVGAILEASELGLAVLIDGFVLTAAALVAASVSPISCRIMIFATKSAEPGQMVAIEAIQAIALANNVVVPSRPALDMGLRMGEATGALMAIPILRSAACVINDMGTIAAIMS